MIIIVQNSKNSYIVKNFCAFHTPLISKIIGKSKCQDGRQTSLKSARLDLSNKPKMEIVH